VSNVRQNFPGIVSIEGLTTCIAAISSLPMHRSSELAQTSDTKTVSIDERKKYDAMLLYACKQIVTRIKHLSNRPNQAVRMLAGVLFSLITIVNLDLLPHVLACCEDAVKQTSPQMRKEFVAMLYALVYRCFDYTRKDILLRWYLRIAHDTNANMTEQ